MDQKKALQMKNEIKVVANFRILKIWKVYLMVFLIVSAFYVQYLGYAETPIYLLILLFLCPSIISYILKDLHRRFPHKILAFSIEEMPFILNTLKRRYQYERLSYLSDSITYLFILILICLWQFNLSNQVNAPFLLVSLPKAIIIGSLLIRYIGSFLYRVKLSHGLSEKKI